MLSLIIDDLWAKEERGIISLLSDIVAPDFNDSGFLVVARKKNQMASVALFLVGKIHKEKLNDITSRNKICIYANLQLVFRIPFILVLITILKMPKHDPERLPNYFVVFQNWFR